MSTTFAPKRPSRLLLFVLKLTGGNTRWTEACSHCKGYPQAFCTCSKRVRFRRWARRGSISSPSEVPL